MHGKRRRRSPLKVDLTKKTGFGPREIEEDDQSKEAAKTRYEMGVKVDPTKKHPLGMEDSEYRKYIYKTTETPRQ